MTKQYTSLEHSIRNIMEGRSNSFEHPKTLEQSILEGGHTLEEKVGPKPKKEPEVEEPQFQDPYANIAADMEAGKKGSDLAAAGELALDLAPITGTYREGGRAVDAFKQGNILQGLGHSALTAVSGIADIATLAGVGAAAGAGLRGSLAAARAARALSAASNVADVAKAAGTAADVAKVADAAKSADAASDAALIRRITSGKKKGSDTPPPANAPETQGNLALKPQEFKPSTKKTDGKIDVQKPANDPGAPGTTNVTSLPPRTTRVTPANPNTRVATPGQAPANLNVPTYKPLAPTTTVKPGTPANQTTAPSVVTRTDPATAVGTGTATRGMTTPGQATGNAPRAQTTPPRDTGQAPPPRRRGQKPKLRLSLPSIKTAFDSKSAAGQASGVGTYMHKAGAPLKVSEENEADKERISIENVARLNSRRNRAVKQQEIQKKILDEKKSLADTVKRNVEETRTKQKMESPIITNPELKRPEPEGINNVR